jgi:hypothetical protein
MRIAHFAFQLGAGHERGDGVDHQNVERTGAHQRVGDFERLLARVGLGDEKIVDIDAELSGVAGIERVFGVDDGAGAAFFLRFGDDLQRERGFTGAFRAVNFDDAPARQAADAKRDIEAERTGGDGLDLRLVLLPGVS